jgi:hypothetical protein
LEEIQSTFKDQSFLIEGYLCNYAEKIVFIKERQRFYFLNHPNDREIILDLLSKPRKVIVIEDQTVKTIFNSLNISEILISQGFNQYGNVFAKPGVSLSAQFSFIASEYVNEPNLSEDQLADYFINLYGPDIIEKKDFKKALNSAFIKYKDKHGKPKKTGMMSKRKLTALKSLFDSFFQNIPVVRIDEFFEIYKDELKQMNIRSIQELCEVLKFFMKFEDHVHLSPKKRISYDGRFILLKS